MTQDEIIEIAKAAHRELVTEYYVGHHGQIDAWTMLLLERFAKLVAAKERQAVLEMAYGYASNLSWNEDFQADIRARGQDAT